jgi:hypothetical protein
MPRARYSSWALGIAASPSSNYAATLSSTTPPVLPNSANVLLKMTDNGRDGKHNIQ